MKQRVGSMRMVPRLWLASLGMSGAAACALAGVEPAPAPRVVSEAPLGTPEAGLGTSQDGGAGQAGGQGGAPVDGGSGVDAAVPRPMAEAGMPEAAVDADPGAVGDSTGSDAGTPGESDAGGITVDAGPPPAEGDSGAPDAAEWPNPDVSECTPGADGDGDSLLDCDELGDADPFTDPDVFNGVRVQTRNHSYTAPACYLMDTVGDVRRLLDGPPDEELDQYAGWDFASAPDDRTHPARGFAPPWTVPARTWQIDAVGYVRLEQGRNCFAVAGRVDQACGTLFIASQSAAEFAGWEAIRQTSAAIAEHGSGAGCFDAQAGTYPIRWHFEMDDLRVHEFHLLYCHGGATDCAPRDALRSRSLRVEP